MWKDKSRLLLLQVRQGLLWWTLSCNSRWCTEAKNPRVRQVPLFQWYAAKNRYWNATHPPPLHPWTESHSTHEYYILFVTYWWVCLLLDTLCLFTKRICHSMSVGLKKKGWNANQQLLSTSCIFKNKILKLRKNSKYYSLLLFLVQNSQTF